MSYGSFNQVTVVVASGASTSSDAVLGGSRPWSRIAVQVGTHSTAMQMMLQNSVDGGSTFKYVFNQMPVTGTLTAFTMNIGTGVATAGGFIALPAGTLLNRVRVVLTGVVSGGASFVFCCMD